MKILIVSPYYAPAWAYGGPPRILHEFSKFLISKGHEMTVFTTNVNDENSVQEEFHKNVDGADVYYFPNVSNWLAYNATIFLPKGMKKVLKERMKEFDIVLLSDARTYPNAIAYKYLKKYNIPYVHLAYGSLPIVGSGIKKLMKQVYDMIWMKKILSEASALIAQTEHERNEYFKLDGKPEKTILVPLATDHGPDQIKGSATYSGQYPIHESDKIILSVGRISKLKVTSLMVEVLDKLVKKDPSYKWVLIGRDDGYLEQIEAEVKQRNLTEHYIFTGPQYGDDKVQLLLRANCFFLAPSHFEETSTAALEALAYGTPCVITEQCEVPYMDDYNAGITTKYDCDEMVAAIEKIISKPKGDYTPNCLKLIQEHFTWEKVGNQFEELLQNIIKGHSNG